MPPTPSLVSLFVEPIDRAGIDRAITGGFATTIDGFPRLTLDVDLVLRLDERDVARFSRLWPAADYSVPPVEVIREESRRSQDGHFNVSHLDSAMRADVYIAGDSEVNAWALRERTIRRIDGTDAYVVPIEAVIVGKRRYFQMGRSDRHLRDIAHLLKVNEAEINRPTLERWIGKLDLEAAWSAAQAFDEPR